MSNPLTELDDGWDCCSSVATLHDRDIPLETPAYAVVSGNVTQVRELAASGAYDRPSDAWTIYGACLQGDLMIRALSANVGLDLNPVILGQTGDRVFHFLLRTNSARFTNSKFESVRRLLQYGVDPLEPDRFGNNALHIITESPDTQESGELMSLMFGNGVPSTTRTSCLSEIDSRNEAYGNTALHIAVIHNNETCAKILLENGANPHLRDLANQTPLCLAIEGRCIGIAHLLLDYGAFVEVGVPISPEMTVELFLHLRL